MNASVPSESVRAFALGLLPEDQLAEMAARLDQEACEESLRMLETIDDTLVIALGTRAQTGLVVEFLEEITTPEFHEQAEQWATRLSEKIAQRRGSNVSRNDVNEERLPVERLRDYELIAPIGKGGMGVVFKARHTRLDRIVAIKLLPSRLTDDADALARFDREMQVIGQLVHPNIVHATDAGEENGVHYLAMEHVDGLDLRAIVRKSGPLSIRDAIDTAIQAARGLTFAHAAGIVHRDVKPANLLRDSNGTIKVLDLGLARIVSEIGSDNRNLRELTNAGTIMGTVDYMAPEQASDTRSADERSDIYSLGCTLHYLLTGYPPYRGKSPIAVVLAHRTANIPSLTAALPGIPSTVDEAFQRSLAKDPAERFETMEAFGAALEQSIATVSDGRSSDIVLDGTLGEDSGRELMALTTVMLSPPVVANDALATRLSRNPIITVVGMVVVSFFLVLIAFRVLVWSDPASYGPAAHEHGTNSSDNFNSKPTEKPPPPMEVVRDEATNAIDLLLTINVDRDTVPGGRTNFRMENGAMIVPWNARLRVPFSMPNEYRIVLEIERINGTSGPFLPIMRVGEFAFGLVIDAPHTTGRSTAIQPFGQTIVLGETVSPNDESLLAEGRPHRLDIEATRERIVVRIDRVTTFAWTKSFEPFALGTVATQLKPAAESMSFCLTSNTADFRVTKALLFDLTVPELRSGLRE